MWKIPGIFNNETIFMKKVSILIIVLLITVNLFAQKTYIWCGTLIDGISNEPKKNMTIVVEKNKITAEENGFTTPGIADKIIDLKTRTVTPGWIDMHLHLEHETSRTQYMETFTFNPPD